MKSRLAERVFGLVVAAAVAVAAPALGTVLTIPMLETTGQNANRTITVTPLDGPVTYNGTLYINAPFPLQPTAGGATNSVGQAVNGATTNFVGGNVRLTFQGISKAVQLYVPFGATNMISAADPAYQRNGIVQTFVSFSTNPIAAGTDIVTSTNDYGVISVSAGPNLVTSAKLNSTSNQLYQLISSLAVTNGPAYGLFYEESGVAVGTLTFEP